MGHAQTSHARSREAGRNPGAFDPSLEQRLAELELIYDAAPIGIFLCDRDLKFIRVNRHLAVEINGIPVEEHIGRSVWEIVPELRQTVEPMFRRVLDFGETILRFELEGETPKARGVRRTWEASYYPIRDEDDHVVAISGIVDDVTDRKAIERARADDRARLQRLLDANLFGVVTSTLEGVMEANDAFLDLVGYSREDFLRHGLDWRKITPPEHVPKRIAIIEQLKDTGTCAAFEQEYIRKDGRRVPVMIGATLLDREPLRWIAFALDLSGRKGREEHIRHLLQELEHRTKNLISVIQAIAHQIVRTSSSLEDFDSRFSARLQALAGIQNLLVLDSWRGAPVRELVLSQLAHCAHLVGRRILLEGPSVSLTAMACQYIGMALHELCTNALKYGSLSGEAGTVTIRWSCQPTERPETFRIEWVEAGGPIVGPSTRNGFGYRVVTQFVERALEAKVSYDRKKAGLQWSLAMPSRFVLNGQHPGKTPS